MFDLFYQKKKEIILDIGENMLKKFNSLEKKHAMHTII